jgi:putative flippase GtrA
MVKLSREVVLFAAGGVGGLLIDTGIVQMLVSFGHWNPYLARIPSFLVAATFTWWWNRHFTFAARESGRTAHAEWLHWIGLMSLGAVVNYGVYALLLASISSLHQWPALAAAAGSAVATLVNFSTARRVLFRRSKVSS